MTDAARTRISAIRESPRRPGRYEIELDGATIDGAVVAKLIVSVDLIAELKLKPGRVLSDTELQRLQSGARLIACYVKAIATLGARARSTADLRRWLKTKEFTDEEISPAVEKLSALGLLDDRAYALSFARSRLAPSRGFGPRRVAAELARKGVARNVVDQVLSELAAERSEAEQEAEARGERSQSAAEQAAVKKLKSLAKLDADTRKRRLYGYLARRGFSGSEITKALKLSEAKLRESQAQD